MIFPLAARLRQDAAGFAQKRQGLRRPQARNSIGRDGHAAHEHLHRSYAALNCEAPVSTIDTPPAGSARSVRHARSIEYVFLRRDVVIL